MFGKLKAVKDTAMKAAGELAGDAKDKMSAAVDEATTKVSETVGDVKYKISDTQRTNAIELLEGEMKLTGVCPVCRHTH